jgi:dienelactone hydrolase
MRSLTALLLLFVPVLLDAQETITFPSKDGLEITADQYISSDTLPYIILCHQAGFSRGEYKNTASRFQKFGYNCLAIDARFGKESNGIKNATAALAKAQDMKVTNLDAEQDILAAIDYIYAKTNKKVILLGSSYSASLVLKIAATNDKVKAVIAFSPGEYFGDKLNVKKSIGMLDKPVFVTSSKAEAGDVTTLMKDVKSKNKTQFIPANPGDHGSKALWKEINPDYNEYWMALLMFMRGI